MKQHKHWRIAAALLGAGLGLNLLSPAHAQTGCLPGKWTQVPGGGITTGTGPAVVALDSDLHLFVVGGGDLIYTNVFRNATSTWTGWSQVPGDGEALGGTGPGAAIHAGKLYLFVTGRDGRIYVNTRASSSWSGWLEVPGAGLSSHAPAGASFQRFGSGQKPELNLFVRGTDGTIQVNKLIGTAWTGWEHVPGGGLTTHGPAAISLAVPGPVAVHVRGLDGADHVNVQSPIDGSWSGWHFNGGFLTAAPGPVATHDAFQMARGIGGGTFYRTFNTAWKALLPKLNTSTAAPTGIVYQGRIQVFVSGPGDRIYCTAK